MNKVWRDYAYQVRLTMALDDQAIPNRRTLRDRLRGDRRIGAIRRDIFGAWRNRGR